VLYVRNLTSDVTEEQLKEKFGAFGKVERVKKIKDYGFVHFEERDAGHLAHFVASDALVGAGVFWEGFHDGQCVESLCGGGHLEVLGGFHQLVVAVPGHHGCCSGRGSVLVRVKLLTRGLKF